MTWLVYSFEHDAWWGANHLGYTEDITEAGRYSLEEAKDICLKANRYLDRLGNRSNLPNELMVPDYLSSDEELDV